MKLSRFLSAIISMTLVSVVSVKYPLVYHSSKICCIIESKQVHRPDEND